MVLGPPDLTRHGPDMHVQLRDGQPRWVPGCSCVLGVGGSLTVQFTDNF